jgi:hypothetical protein
VAGLAATPHVTAHSVLPVQVVLQSPSHFTLHVDESAHAIVLPSPTWSLQFALVLHTALASAPSLKSQVELAVQVTWLLSPPTPLHSDESLHVTRNSSLELPSHFVDSVQLSEQALSPHSVLQSTPATQVHAESLHAQPVPEHTGSLSPPHAAMVARHNVISHLVMEPPAPSSVEGRANANGCRRVQRISVSTTQVRPGSAAGRCIGTPIDRQ